MVVTIQNGCVDLGDRTVLREISITFGEELVTGVLGPNGAGKTTLLRTLAGLVPLAKGKITVGDRELRALTRKEVARRVGYLSQNNEIPFPFPVEDVVMMGRYAHLRRFHPEGPDDQRATDQALQFLDAESLRDRPINELSGGERQRVLLARTLATEAPILLLDEPVANLDIRHCLDILEILKMLASAGRTVVVALHDLNLAYRYCDRLVLIHDGVVLAQGNGKEVLQVNALRTAFDVETRCVGNGNDGYFIFARRIN